MILRACLARQSRLLYRPASRFMSTLPETMPATSVEALAPLAPRSSVPPTPKQISEGSSLTPRPATPNPIFIPPAADPLLSLLASVIMKDGKKHRASRTITDALSYVQAITLCPPLPILREAIRLTAPSVKVVTLRKPGKNVMAPRPLTERQQVKQAFRWILTTSEKRPERKLSHRLGKEFVNIIRGNSDALENKAAVHRLATVNRANAPRR